MVRYSIDQALAGPCAGAGIERALALARAWSDLEWDKMEAEFERMRHSSAPMPPSEL